MLVHLIPHIGIGGDVVVVKAMVRALEGTRQPILVNGLSPADAFGGTTPNPLPLNRGAAGFREAWTRRDVVPRNASVIHAHSPICLAFALLLRRFRCRTAKVVLTFHWPVPESGLRRGIKGALLRMSDIVHVCSSESLETVRDRYRVPNERLRLLRTGVPADRFVTPDPVKVRSALRARLGIPESARVIGYLGRLATEKNVDYLIRFMDEHAPAQPNLHLIIAGGGGLDGELREQTGRSSVPDRIRFTGYSREPERIYPAFDLMVLPSDIEAFPLVVVEAAYCGVPTLRSDVDGSRDQIEEGVTGFIYPQKQGYEGMRKALSKILEQRWEELPAVGRAARTHCLQLCDMGRFGEGLEAMYRAANA
jgi:glycosyltransferase involved in cell wall biosynthesis